MALIGHTHITEFFAHVQKKNALNHAYLFAGPEHVGKRTYAEQLAAQLLQVPREKLHTHLDFSVVQQEKNEKTGKTKKYIDVDQIRNLRDMLRRHAAMGGYKIALIDGAEKMNQSASNALLKTLEEPADKTILVLITSNPQALLPTILSRCQQLFFAPVPEDALKAGYPEATAEMIDLSRGRPGLVHRWLEDEERFAQVKEEVQRFLSLFGKPLYEKMKLVEDLFGDKTDHIAQRGVLIDVLGTWQCIVRDYLCGQNGQPVIEFTQIPAQWSTESALKAEEEIAAARRYMKQNIHPKLLVEHVLLSIP